MTIAGMSATGYDTVGDIVATHMWQYHLTTDATTVAMDILTHHLPMVPVVDDNGVLAGFVGECEILDALRTKRNLENLTAGSLMSEDRTTLVHEGTSISAVIKLFQDRELQIIPVIRNNQVIKSLTRHDLIRALIGAGLGVEKQ